MSHNSQLFTETLESAKDNVDEAYHSFLIRYSNERAEVYGFIEGRDDLPFYRSLISRLLPDPNSLWLVSCGNRDKVMRTYANIDWTRFPRARLAFFIDRDFRDLCGEKEVFENLYVTDGYSIENSILSEDLFFGLVQDSFGISGLSDSDEQAIRVWYRDGIESGCRSLNSAMEYMLAWRLSKSGANLQNIRTSRLIAISEGKFSPLGTLDEELITRSGAELPSQEQVEQARAIIESDELPWIMRVRGKQLLHIFVELCDNIASFLTANYGNGRKYRSNVSFGTSNACVTLAPRCVCPPSLNEFVQRTYLVFLNPA